MKQSNSLDLNLYHQLYELFDVSLIELVYTLIYVAASYIIIYSIAIFIDKDSHRRYKKCNSKIYDVLHTLTDYEYWSTYVWYIDIILIGIMLLTITVILYWKGLS